MSVKKSTTAVKRAKKKVRLKMKKLNNIERARNARNAKSAYLDAKKRRAENMSKRLQTLKESEN